MPKHRLMPVLCTKCLDRARNEVISIETGNIVQFCDACTRLWDRSNNAPVATVVYYSDGTQWRLNAGDAKPKKLKGKSKD